MIIIVVGGKLNCCPVVLWKGTREVGVGSRRPTLRPEAYNIVWGYTYLVQLVLPSITFDTYGTYTKVRVAEQVYHKTLYHMKKVHALPVSRYAERL